MMDSHKNTPFTLIFSALSTIDDDSEAAVVMILSSVFMGCVMYAHIGFIVEVQRGIMSRETYPREAYCSCCTPMYTTFEL